MQLIAAAPRPTQQRPCHVSRRRAATSVRPSVQDGRRMDGLKMDRTGWSVRSPGSHETSSSRVPSGARAAGTAAAARGARADAAAKGASRVPRRRSVLGSSRAAHGAAHAAAAARAGGRARRRRADVQRAAAGLRMHAAGRGVRCAGGLVRRNQRRSMDHEHGLGRRCWRRRAGLLHGAVQSRVQRGWPADEDVRAPPAHAQTLVLFARTPLTSHAAHAATWWAIT
jgi:hypothetical protein